MPIIKPGATPFGGSSARTAVAELQNLYYAPDITDAIAVPDEIKSKIAEQYALFAPVAALAQTGMSSGFYEDAIQPIQAVISQVSELGRQIRQGLERAWEMITKSLRDLADQLISEVMEAIQKALETISASLNVSLTGIDVGIPWVQIAVQMVVNFLELRRLIRKLFADNSNRPDNCPLMVWTEDAPEGWWNDDRIIVQNAMESLGLSATTAIAGEVSPMSTLTALWYPPDPGGYERSFELDTGGSFNLNTTDASQARCNTPGYRPGLGQVFAFQSPLFSHGLLPEAELGSEEFNKWRQGLRKYTNLKSVKPWVPYESWSKGLCANEADAILGTSGESPTRYEPKKLHRGGYTGSMGRQNWDEMKQYFGGHEYHAPGGAFSTSMWVPVDNLPFPLTASLKDQVFEQSKGNGPVALATNWESVAYAWEQYFADRFAGGSGKIDPTLAGTIHEGCRGHGEGWSPYLNGSGRHSPVAPCFSVFVYPHKTLVFTSYSGFFTGDGRIEDPDNDFHNWLQERMASKDAALAEGKGSLTGLWTVLGPTQACGVGWDDCDPGNAQWEVEKHPGWAGRLTNNSCQTFGYWEVPQYVVSQYWYIRYVCERLTQHQVNLARTDAAAYIPESIFMKFPNQPYSIPLAMRSAAMESRARMLAGGGRGMDLDMARAADPEFADEIIARRAKSFLSPVPPSPPTAITPSKVGMRVPPAPEPRQGMSTAGKVALAAAVGAMGYFAYRRFR